MNSDRSATPTLDLPCNTLSLLRPSRPLPPWRQPPNFFSLCLITLIVANYLGTFADLDWAWATRTGQRVLETHQVAPPDTFTYTIAGQPVRDFESLYDLLLLATWSGFGMGGLKLLKTILVITPLLLMAGRLRKEGVRWHGIALALLAAVVILSPGWNLRPLYFSTIGLLLVSGWLHDHSLGRRPLTWWLPVVMLLWCNLHPGVIMGQGLLAGAIAWEWLNRWVRLNRPLDVAGCRRLTLVGGVGLLATFASPEPIQRMLYPFRPEVAHPIQRIFVEMQPLHTFFLRPPYGLTLVYVVAALVALTVVLRFRQYRLWEIALLVALTGFANLAVRSLQDWTLIMLALGVPHLVALLRQASRVRRRAWATAVLRVDRFAKHVFNSPYARFQWFWPAAAVAVLAVLSLIPPVGRRMPIQNAALWPVKALDWMEAHDVHGQIFTLPDYGTYLGWRLGDRAQCYVDTRGYFFPHDLIEDSHYIPQLGPDWRARLDRVLARGTDYFFLETTGPRGELWRQLQPYVPEPLYLDDQSVLLSTQQLRDGLARWEQVAE